MLKNFYNTNQEICILLMVPILVLIEFNELADVWYAYRGSHCLLS